MVKEIKALRIKKTQAISRIKELLKHDLEIWWDKEGSFVLVTKKYETVNPYTEDQIQRISRIRELIREWYIEKKDM